MDSPISFPPSSPPRLSPTLPDLPVWRSSKQKSTSPGLLPAFVPSSPGGTSLEDQPWANQLNRPLSKAELSRPHSKYATERNNGAAYDDLPSSPPGFPSHITDDSSSKSAFYYEDDLHYPTPAPSSSLGLQSSPPPCGPYQSDNKDEDDDEDDGEEVDHDIQASYHDGSLQDAYAKRGENLVTKDSHATFKDISEDLTAELPEAGLSVIRVSKSGEEVTVGRSSQSCDFALSSKNKLVSRVHVCVAYLPVVNRMSFTCVGWNGCRIIVPEFITLKSDSSGLENMENIGGKNKEFAAGETIPNGQTDYILPKGQRIEINYVEGICIDVRGEIARVVAVDEEEKTCPKSRCERSPLKSISKEKLYNNIDELAGSPAKLDLPQLPNEALVPTSRPQPISKIFTLGSQARKAVLPSKPADTKNITAHPRGAKLPTPHISKLKRTASHPLDAKLPTPQITKLKRTASHPLRSKLPTPQTTTLKRTASHPLEAKLPTSLSTDLKCTASRSNVKLPVSLARETQLPSNDPSEVKKASSTSQLTKLPSIPKKVVSSFPFKDANTMSSNAEPRQSLTKRTSTIALLDSKEPKSKRIAGDAPRATLLLSKTDVTKALPQDMISVPRLDSALDLNFFRKEPIVSINMAEEEEPIKAVSVGVNISIPQQLDEEVAKLDITQLTNLICNHLAFSRLSSTPLSTLKSSSPVLGSIPKRLLRHLLRDGKAIPCVGIIYRQGKDAAGKPLEEEYYYVAEKDADMDRKAMVEQLRGRGSGLRACRKTHKQYFWKKPAK